MIKFYATNLIDQATISTDSENLLFPKSNIQHDFRTKVFRSTANTVRIIFDLQETSAIDSLVIVDHPREGFGFSVGALMLNATSDFSSPAFSQDITISHTHGIAYAEFTQQEYRFAALDLVSTGGYCELSNLFLGKKIEFDSGAGPEFGWKFRDDELSTTKKNAWGQRFTDVKARQKKFSWDLKALNKTELDQMFELIDLCGETKPFFFRMGTTDMINDPDRLSGMYFISNVPDITNFSFGLWNMPMSVEEAM
jgi:hypothetical protein